MIITQYLQHSRSHFCSDFAFNSPMLCPLTLRLAHSMSPVHGKAYVSEPLDVCS